MNDFQRYGNRMMIGIDQDPVPNPDDYSICPEWGEQTHVDWMVHYAKDENATMCSWCYKKTPHIYRCNGCEKYFAFTGVPARCLNCGGFDIIHEWAWSDVQSLIREEQKKFLELAQDMSIITPGMISSRSLELLRDNRVSGG